MEQEKEVKFIQTSNGYKVYTEGTHILLGNVMANVGKIKYNDTKGIYLFHPKIMTQMISGQSFHKEIAEKLEQLNQKEE